MKMQFEHKHFFFIELVQGDYNYKQVVNLKVIISKWYNNFHKKNALIRIYVRNITEKTRSPVFFIQNNIMPLVTP